MLKSTHITIFGLNLCHKEQNFVAHIWADLEGSIDGLIEGTGELLAYRLQNLLRWQPVPGCLPHVGVLDVLQEPCLILVVSACIPEQKR